MFNLIFIKRKIVCTILSIIMVLSFTTNVFAFSNMSKPEIQTNSHNMLHNNVVQKSLSNVSYEKGNYETQGVKGWLAKKAMKGIANALRKGASNKWVKKAVNEYFDKKTAKVFLKSLDDIADKLDEFIAKEQFAKDYVKDRLYELMMDITGDNYGISLSIADGVVALIEIFLL